jgi:hypothetical protein
MTMPPISIRHIRVISVAALLIGCDETATSSTSPVAGHERDFSMARAPESPTVQSRRIVGELA